MCIQEHTEFKIGNETLPVDRECALVGIDAVENRFRANTAGDSPNDGNYFSVSFSEGLRLVRWREVLNSAISETKVRRKME